MLYDDIISTAGTIVGPVDVARRNGAKGVYVCATHGVLCGPAVERLKAAALDQIVVTDSMPVAAEKLLPNLKVNSVAALFAKATQRIHGNESTSALFTDDALGDKKQRGARTHRSRHGGPAWPPRAGGPRRAGHRSRLP